jgi:hypothetical protein
MKTSEAVVKYSQMSPMVAKMVERLKTEPEAVKAISDAKGHYDAILLMKLLPFLMKGDEIYEMIGVYYGKSAQEIKDEEFKEFTTQVKTMMEDSSLTSFIKASN